MWDSYNNGKLPITTDAERAMLSAVQGETHVTCFSHTLCNLIKRTFGEDAKFTEELLSGFNKQIKSVLKFVRKAPKAKKRQTALFKSVNSYLWGKVPTDAEAEIMAKLDHPNFDDLTEEQKNKVKAGYDQFPLLSRVQDVRFTSLDTQLRNMVANKV